MTMTENTELLIIGAVTFLIMLYLSWKIFVGLMWIIINQLNKDHIKRAPPVRLRKRGPWDAPR